MIASKMLHGLGATASLMGVLICATGSIGRAQTRHLEIYASGNIRMLVVDPAGRKLGYEAQTGLYFTEIPNGNIGSSAIGNLTEEDNSGEQEAGHQIDCILNEPSDGNYIVVVSGTRAGFYGLNFFAGHLAERTTNVIGGGIVDSGLTVTYRFNYSFGGATQTSLVKVVSATSLIQDVAAMRKLGWISSQSTTDKYSNLILEYNAQLQQSSYSGARASLRSLLQNITSDSMSTLTKDACKSLRPDVEYLLRQLPTAPH